MRLALVSRASADMTQSTHIHYLSQAPSTSSALAIDLTVSAGRYDDDPACWLDQRYHWTGRRWGTWEHPQIVGNSEHRGRPPACAAVSPGGQSPSTSPTGAKVAVALLLSHPSPLTGAMVLQSVSSLTHDLPSRLDSTPLITDGRRTSTDRGGVLLGAYSLGS